MQPKICVRMVMKSIENHIMTDKQHAQKILNRLVKKLDETRDQHLEFIATNNPRKIDTTLQDAMNELHFEIRLLASEYGLKVQRKRRTESTIYHDFIVDRMQFVSDENVYVSIPELYEVFIEYADGDMIRIPTLQQFGLNIRKTILENPKLPVSKKRYINKDGTKVFAIFGAALKNAKIAV